MKIFEFSFYNTDTNDQMYINVLTNSETEALDLLKQNKHTQNYFKFTNIEFRGCNNVFELDKPKVLV